MPSEELIDEPFDEPTAEPTVETTAETTQEPTTAPTETPEPTPNGYSLTPGGNAELVDDLHDTDRDFITVQTRDGNTFYIVIDRTKDNSENVYFLNMVDAADLLPLLKDSDISSGRITCTCSERCEQGHVNLNCPVCASNIADCQGHEDGSKSLTENESSAAAKPDTSSDSDESNNKPSTPSAQSIAALVVVVAVIAAAVVFMLKKKKNGKSGTKHSKKPQPDYDLAGDEYDDDDDDDDYGDEDDNFTGENDDPNII